MKQKKTLILDIGKERVWAGVFSSGRPSPRGLVSAVIPPGDAGLKQALSIVLDRIGGEKGGRGLQRVLASVPAEDLCIRVVEMPFNERRKVLEALPFELAGLLHVEVEDVVADAVPLGGGKFLAVAVERRLVGGYLELLDSLGIDPCWLGSGLFAVPALARELYGTEGVKAVLFPGAMAVMEDGSPRLFKPVWKLDGVRLGAAFLDAEGLLMDEVHYTGWEEAELKEIFHGARLIPLDLPEGWPPEGALAYALALIDGKGLLNDAVNFRRGEYEYTREKAAFRRGLRLAASLAAVLALLAGGDLYVRYLGLSMELDSYRHSLRSAYRELFPGEKDAAHPVYQLEARVKSLQKEGRALGVGTSSLEALSGIARAAPQGIRITELVIAEDGMVAVKGEAPTFEAAGALKEALAGGPLRDVSLNETKAGAEGGASFSISAYLR